MLIALVAAAAIQCVGDTEMRLDNEVHSREPYKATFVIDDDKHILSIFDPTTQGMVPVCHGPECSFGPRAIRIQDSASGGLMLDRENGKLALVRILRRGRYGSVISKVTMATCAKADLPMERGSTNRF